MLQPRWLVLAQLRISSGCCEPVNEKPSPHAKEGWVHLETVHRLCEAYPQQLMNLDRRALSRRKGARSILNGVIAFFSFYLKYYSYCGSLQLEIVRLDRCHDSGDLSHSVASVNKWVKSLAVTFRKACPARCSSSMGRA
jgi:hypothetical protein